MNQSIPAASTLATVTGPSRKQQQLEKAQDEPTIRDKGAASTISDDSSEQKDNVNMNSGTKARSEDVETEDDVEDRDREMERSSQIEANVNVNVNAPNKTSSQSGQSQTEVRRPEKVNIAKNSNSNLNNNFAMATAMLNNTKAQKESITNSNSMAMNAAHNNMNMSNSMNMNMNMNSMNVNMHNNVNMKNNSTSDLLRSKLAAAAASASNNQIDLELLRSMVQARAAATMGDNNSHSHDLMNTAASAFSGGIDPSILSKALGLSNGGGVNQNLFGSNNNQGLSQGLLQAQQQSLQQDKSSRSQSGQSNTNDNNNNNMNVGHNNSNQNQNQHMSNSSQKEASESINSSSNGGNNGNGNSNSRSNSMESQSKDVAANLLGLQQSTGISNGNHASTLQALKDAAAGLSSQNQNPQSDVKMDDSQQQLQNSSSSVNSNTNVNTTSNLPSSLLGGNGPANLSDLNQGLSLSPALMSLLQKAQGVGGQNSSYMDTLQQLVKQQQQLPPMDTLQQLVKQQQQLPPMDTLQQLVKQQQQLPPMDTLQQLVKQQQQLPPNLSSLGGGGDTSSSVHSMNSHPAVSGGNINGIGNSNSMHLSTAAGNTVLPPPPFPKNNANEMSTTPPSPGSSGAGGVGIPNGDGNGSGNGNGNGSDSNMGDAYRDYSKMSSSTSNDFNKSQPPGKEPPFPVKLHRILSNPEYSDIVSWLPHGRSWRVLKPKAFEEKVIPLYFRHAKYASFMRQVNGWGFKRMTQGPDHNSYYHELFLRGMQHLCYKMRRPTRARIDADPDFNPDFYRLSIVAPLPNQEGGNGMNSAIPNVPPGTNGNGPNKPIVPSLPPTSVLQKAGGLASLAGVNNMSSLAGMNMGMNGHGVDNALSSNLLQQQLQHNQNGGANKFAGLSQGLQNAAAGGNSLPGLSTGNSDQDQLEALKQRKDELVLQLQRMVRNNNNINNMNTANQGMNLNQNASSLLNSNSGSNTAGLPNELGNMGSLFNQRFGSSPSTQLQLQQMMGLGGFNGINGGGQNSMLGNSGAFGAGNQTNDSLSMNNLSSNLSNSPSSNLGNNLSNNLNSFGGGLGGGLAGLDQQLFMHGNGMGGANGLRMNNMGLGGMNNSMSQHLGAVMPQANQFMGQQGNNCMSSDENSSGNNSPPCPPSKL